MVFFLITNLKTDCKQQPTIRFKQYKVGLDAPNYLSIFGAKIVELESCTFVCGGTGLNPKTLGQTMFEISFSESEQCEISRFRFSTETGRLPLMIGSTIASVDNSLIVVGGGATCFSMGTYWETGIYKVTISGGLHHTIHEGCSNSDTDRIELLESPRIVGCSRSNTIDDDEPLKGKPTISVIPRLSVTTPEQFEDILREGVPVILEGLHLGNCTRFWTSSHITDAVGQTKKVSTDAPDTAITP